MSLIYLERKNLLPQSTHTEMVSLMNIEIIVCKFYNSYIVYRMLCCDRGVPGASLQKLSCSNLNGLISIRSKDNAIIFANIFYEFRL